MTQMPARLHQETVMRSLAALGVDPGRLLAWEVLAGGASGAVTCRVRFAQGDMILKATGPGSPETVVERTRREIRFYRHLASQAPVPVPRLVASRCDGATGACLLMEAYDPSPEPRNWTEASCLQAAGLLGRLHATYWGRERELSAIGWLRRAPEVGEADVRHARDSWARPSAN